MQYKNILVYLDQGASNEERVNTAVSIAKVHDAELMGVVVNALPTKGMMRTLGLKKDSKKLKKSRESVDAVIDSFSQKMREEDITFETQVIECREGKAPEKLTRLARCFDICLLRQANPDKPHANFISELSEHVLFYSGRPVFFMPYIGAHAIPCRTALIAWDGSASATRAIHDALPLLEQINKVIILVVETEEMHRNLEGKPGAALSKHLNAHGIKNTINRVPLGDVRASTVILNEISNTGADILIMGGYGTPKLREMLLGGVTRTVFDSMTVPVVMSH